MFLKTFWTSIAAPKTTYLNSNIHVAPCLQSRRHASLAEAEIRLYACRALSPNTITLHYTTPFGH